MKKAYFLSVLIWCLLVLAACGKTDEEPHYYEIRVESGQLEEAEKDQFLMGRQYYQGEPVSILAEPSADQGAGCIDVYVRPMGGDKKLLLRGVSENYRSGGWFLDEKGRCFIRGATGITRLDADGKLLYHSKTEGMVRDICCLEGGRIILMTGKDSILNLWELEPDTGQIARIDKATMQFGKGGYAYIGAGGENLMLLDGDGFWRIDLKKGTKEPALTFTGTAYTLAEGTPTDFRIDGSKAEILWDEGRLERLEWVDITGKKEIITVRGTVRGWLKRQAALFNQSNDIYYVVIEEPGEGVSGSDFRAETGLKLAAGKGADIICANAVADVPGLIEKGVFADLAPLMEASGIREEEYSQVAFDAWREDEKIYGFTPGMEIQDYVLDKEILNGREVLTIENLVDFMLEFEGDRVFMARAGGDEILEYFMKGSEDLWGMVDWESGSCDFSGELFAQMLRAAKRYAADERYQYPAIVSMRYCSGFYLLDNEMKRNQVHLGVFFDDGHYAFTGSGVGDAMGINAGAEHVEGAWEFLAFLMGEEAQSLIDYRDHAFPVNRAAFESLIQYELEECKATTEIIHDGVVYTIPANKRHGQEFTEEQAEEFRLLFAETRSIPYRTKPLRDIIKEETAYYFDGAKSMEDVIAVIENKIQLYLDEHKTGSM